MFGFNWVDIIVIALLATAVVEGIRIGILTQLFVISGFFGALFLAGWAFPHILPIHDMTLRALINGGLVFTTACYVAMRSFDLGQSIHWSFRLGKRISKRTLKWLETVLGSLPGLLAGLALVWLAGVGIGRMPFEGFSNSVSDSRIVQQLTRSLPPVPAVFALFGRQVNPNAQPYVFIQPKPQADFNYSSADFARAAAKATPSIVRITSFGCGGIMSGTGFAVGPDLVATNAHVIAGVKRPIIKYQNNSYEGVPVYFDTALDLALLRVSHLRASPLTLDPSNAPLGSTVAVTGYPGGNYLVVPGLLRDTRAVAAKDIYDQGIFGRGIYVTQTHVDSGSSGSPLVLADGRVVGIVFSKSTDVSDNAYALTSPHIAAALHAVEKSYRRVSTRACIVD